MDAVQLCAIGIRIGSKYESDGNYETDVNYASGAEQLRSHHQLRLLKSRKRLRLFREIDLLESGPFPLVVR